jgi:hypothetical protein
MVASNVPSATTDGSSDSFDEECVRQHGSSTDNSLLLHIAAATSM